MRQWLLFSLRSILIGWAALALIIFVLERPLLRWTAPILGVRWFATAGLAFDCAAMAATGWAVGRLNRASPILAVLVFAATLTFWDLSALLPINMPWLVRLLANTLRDARYFDSLVSTAATQAFLFGSLLAGGLLSRPKTKPISLSDQGASGDGHSARR